MVDKLGLKEGTVKQELRLDLSNVTSECAAGTLVVGCNFESRKLGAKVSRSKVKDRRWTVADYASSNRTK